MAAELFSLRSICARSRCAIAKFELYNTACFALCSASTTRAAPNNTHARVKCPVAFVGSSCNPARMYPKASSNCFAAAKLPSPASEQRRGHASLAQFDGFAESCRFGVSAEFQFQVRDSYLVVRFVEVVIRGNRPPETPGCAPAQSFCVRRCVPLL